MPTFERMPRASAPAALTNLDHAHASYARKTARGECYRCPNPRYPGRTACLDHLWSKSQDPNAHREAEIDRLVAEASAKLKEIA